MMWSLVWWPHAIAHGLNPLLTKVIWAPSGYNLARSTSITLASLLGSPFTLTFGPVATYNILCLISLPIDAFCGFLLCRHIARNYPAALLGGYIFGFSPFMLGHLTSRHLHLLLAFSVPLCIYLTLLRIEARINQRNFIFLLASILVVQFLLSLEIFATMTMFGAFGLLLNWSFGSNRHRKIPKTDPHLIDELWLGKGPNGLVNVGEEVWYSAVAPMVKQLHGVATEFTIPIPTSWPRAYPGPSNLAVG
jgi:hypothetical protein